jgi:hypothetical protein
MELSRLPVDAECRIGTMSVEELSLDELSEQENLQLWAAEAQRRDAQMDSDPGSGRPAEDVFREAWPRIK